MFMYICIVACVPVFVLYIIWAFSTLNGRITGKYSYIFIYVCVYECS
jgi:cytochrome bd-type quinol oxidase subunit 2